VEWGAGGGKSRGAERKRAKRFEKRRGTERKGAKRFEERREEVRTPARREAGKGRGIERGGAGGGCARGWEWRRKLVDFLIMRTISQHKQTGGHLRNNSVV
jgi:hypothetical protein